MRLISQNKMSDLPYEKYTIEIHDYDGEWLISAFIDIKTCDVLLGSYKTKEKALKVMEMIRKTVNGEESHNFRITYKGIYGNWFTELIDTLYTYDKVKEIAKKFIEDNEDYTEYDISVNTYLGNKCNYFYMPQDDEVE